MAQEEPPTGQPPVNDPTQVDAEPDLDLSERKSEKQPDDTLQPAGQYSPAWAKVVKPISWAIIALLSLLMVIPFFLIWEFSSKIQITIPAGTKPEDVAALVKAANEATAAQNVKDMLDWAKTFLPSLIGFATAMIGYYFGIRSGTSGQNTTQGSSGASNP
jgi:hypothetical protein